MADWSEIILRLGAATLAGCAIGLDRDLRGKPIGLKTLGLVSLSTATVVLLAHSADDLVRIRGREFETTARRPARKR